MGDHADPLRDALMLASSEHGAHDVVTVDQAVAVCDAYFAAMPATALADPASTAVDAVAADAVERAVRAIHTTRSMVDGYGMPSPYCVECVQVWPCATIAAMDDAWVVDAEIVDDTREEPF